jgi:hypothetical protein
MTGEKVGSGGRRDELTELRLGKWLHALLHDPIPELSQLRDRSKHLRKSAKLS